MIVWQLLLLDPSCFVAGEKAKWVDEVDIFVLELLILVQLHSVRQVYFSYIPCRSLHNLMGAQIKFLSNLRCKDLCFLISFLKEQAVSIGAIYKRIKTDWTQSLCLKPNAVIIYNASKRDDQMWQLAAEKGEVTDI